MEKTNERTTSGTRKGPSPVSGDAVSTDDILKKHSDALLEIHTYISGVEFNRHRKTPDPLMANVVAFLAQAQGDLNRYLKQRIKDEEYGKE